MSEIEDIQMNYIAELRALAPELRAWFDLLIAREGEDRVLLRWATGLAGHPRVIEVFRRYYMQIEDLNNRNEVDFRTPPPPEQEALWGRDDLGETPRFERHIDWLANDIRTVAPDIFDLVEGMHMVPVGNTASGETV